MGIGAVGCPVRLFTKFQVPSIFKAPVIWNGQIEKYVSGSWDGLRSSCDIYEQKSYAKAPMNNYNYLCTGPACVKSVFSPEYVNAC